jgi:hypothetical protein
VIREATYPRPHTANAHTIASHSQRTHYSGAINFSFPYPLHHHVRVGHHEEDHVLVYTDASDSPDHSGMGIVIIDKKNNTKYVSECIVPPKFISELRKDRSAIINHLELLAIECAFNTFGDILRS